MCLKILTGYFQQTMALLVCSKIKGRFYLIEKQVDVLLPHVSSLEILRIRDICVTKRKQQS